MRNRLSLLLALSASVALAQTTAQPRPPADDNDVSRMSFPATDAKSSHDFEESATSIQGPQGAVQPSAAPAQADAIQPPPHLAPPVFRDQGPPGKPPVAAPTNQTVPKVAAVEVNPNATAVEPGIDLPLVPPPRFRKQFQFKGEPLADVIGEISLEFRTPLVLEADPALPVTGLYSGTDATAILRLLADDAKLSYEKRDGVIYVLPAKPSQLLVARLDDIADQHPGLTLQDGQTGSSESGLTLIKMVMDPKKGPVMEEQVKADPAMDARLRSLSMRRANLLVERRKLINQFP